MVDFQPRFSSDHEVGIDTIIMLFILAYYAFHYAVFFFLKIC